MDIQDSRYLKRAVELAEIGLKKGNAPFGALLVLDDEILYEDHNKTVNGDNTEHPEINIAKWASQNLDESARQRSIVYTSGEHCPMCAVAHSLNGLGKIVYVSSSKDLNEWKKEFGIEMGNVASFSIEEVVHDAIVEGPYEPLKNDVKELQRRYFETVRKKHKS